MFGARSSLISNAPRANRYHTVEELTRELKAARLTIAHLAAENAHLRAAVDGLTLDGHLPSSFFAPVRFRNEQPPAGALMGCAGADDNADDTDDVASPSSSSPSRRRSDVRNSPQRAVSLNAHTASRGARDGLVATSRIVGSRALYSTDKYQSKVEHFCFVCPLTNEIFVDPVVASDGVTYERWAIEKWMTKHAQSPVVAATLTTTDVVPNATVRRLVALRFPAGRQGNGVDLTDWLPPEILDIIFNFQHMFR